MNIKSDIKVRNILIANGFVSLPVKSSIHLIKHGITATE